MLMPQLNHEKFNRACRGAGLKNIANKRRFDIMNSNREA